MTPTSRLTVWFVPKPMQGPQRLNFAPTRRRFALCLMGGLSSIVLSACGGISLEQSAVPEAERQTPVELSGQTQNALTERIDELLEAQISAEGPGVAVLVTYNNQVLYAKGRGLSDVEQGIAIASDSVFDLASVSKSMTALAVLLLQDRGKLSLNDPVTQHIPDFVDPNPDNPIRISHLIHHTSGLSDYLSEWDWDNDADALPGFGIDAHLDWLNQQEPQEAVGTAYRYSDTGYALLALLVQRVSRQPFPDFMAQQIFEPAGMDQTAVYPALGHVFPGQVQGYAVDGDKIEAVSFPVVMWGDGNVFTSIADLAQYDKALRQGQLLSPETLALMFQDGTLDNGKPVATKNNEGYGAGWNLTEDYAHHRGGWAGMSSYYRFYTQLPLSVVVLSNDGMLDSQELGEAIAKQVSQWVTPELAQR